MTVNTVYSKCPYPIPKTIIYNPNAIINYSNLNIPKQVAMILGFGPKFNLPVTNKVNKKKLLIDIETKAIQINRIFGNIQNKDTLNERIKDIITKYKNSTWKTSKTNDVSEFLH